MDRRTFLESAIGTGALVTAGGLATPAISQRAAARTLRLCRMPISPIPDLERRVHRPQRRTAGMGHAVRRRQHARATSANGRGRGSVGGWPHLDVRPAAGTEVPRRRAGSCERRSGEHQPVGSAGRHGADDQGIENELITIDDRTFRWALKKPYPKMPLALGKTGTPCCFVMPARIAATDPFRQIGEYVGSGPMRFVRDEWVPGAKAVFEKFAGYARVRGQRHGSRAARTSSSTASRG
jgi:peptide/nickel transport system substrate-binding protein